MRLGRRSETSEASEGQMFSFESDCWADAMALHLETVQWKVRHAIVIEEPLLGPESPLDSGHFAEEEVALVVARLRKNQATGPDKIHAEFWQTTCEDPHSLDWLTSFCNKCWGSEELPRDWHTAHATAIYKTGPLTIVTTIGRFR